MNLKTLRICVITAAGAASGLSATAAEWSDTWIGERYGTRFREPFNNENISKNIVSLTHVSGYKYGTNFFNADLLMSDRKDGNAQEAYVVYRHTLDLGKVTGKSFAYGPVRGMGLTAGFDLNTKNDTGYGSKKRMLVLGPTFMADVPGFLNISLLLLHEFTATTRGEFTRHRFELRPSDLWSAQPLLQRRSFVAKAMDEFRRPNDFRLMLLKLLPARIIDQPNVSSQRCQSAIGIVLAEE